MSLAKSPVAGSTREDSRRRRRILLEAARELFAESGYEATSTNTLIMNAGGSKSTIYSYFGDKEGLFLAVVEDWVRDMLVPLQELPREHESLFEHLFALGERTLEVLTSETGLGLSRVVYMESPKFPAIGEIFYKHGPQRSMRKLEKYLDAEVKLGKVRCTDTKIAAEAFWGMLLHKPMLQGMCSVAEPMTPRRRSNYVAKVVTEFLDKFVEEV